MRWFVSGKVRGKRVKVASKLGCWKFGVRRRSDLLTNARHFEAQDYFDILGGEIFVLVLAARVAS